MTSGRHGSMHGLNKSQSDIACSPDMMLLKGGSLMGDADRLGGLAKGAVIGAIAGAAKGATKKEP